MNKRIPISVAVSVTILAMTVTFAITWLVSMQTFDQTMGSVTKLQAQYSKLAEIDNYVRRNFYGEISEDTLFDSVANGYMNGLGDRYSTYYNEREYSELMQIENGTLVGVGIEVLREADGNFRIVRVHENSPAARAGVTANGRIISVDGVDAKTYTSRSGMLAALRGQDGTDLALVCTYGVADEQSFTIRRTRYTAPTVESVMVGDYCYIRIYSFTASTYSDFDYLVRQALNEEVKGFVFDVRNNAGGLFRYSYDMIDILCPRGTVARAEYKNGTTSVLATSDENFVDKPMVVLVNGNTSAAAELFAASLRDLNGAQIVGVRTVGRGTVQLSPQRLADGSAVVVTTAILYTGAGDTFHGTGLQPGVTAEAIEGEEAYLYTLQPTQDTQTLRAFEALRGLVRERGEDPGPAITKDTALPGTGTPTEPGDSDVTDDSSLPADGSEAGDEADSSSDDDTAGSSSSASSSSAP